MIKRPIDKRFSQPVLNGLKITTIRDKPWPLGVFIMLYNWTGAPYRSKQIDVAPVFVKTAGAIAIHHREADGAMFYSLSHAHPNRLLWETEGFGTSAEMDDWFRPLVKPGQTLTKYLMRFKLAPSLPFLLLRLAS